jgi:hypothetical protein
MITFSIYWRDVLIFIPTAIIFFWVGAFMVSYAYRTNGYKLVRKNGKTVVEKLPAQG